MLFRRVYDGRPRRPLLLQGNTVLSVTLHLTALAIVAWHAGIAGTVTSAVAEGIVFLAPLPTPSAGPEGAQERIDFTRLEGTGGDEPIAGSDAGSRALPLPEATGEQAGGNQVGAREPARDQLLPNVFELRADSVYLSSQVDNPAAFDSRSAAPAYPDSLRVAGVEGSVTAQFVVDTTGRVDVSSFVLLESTHGRFTQSVRQALPQMLFRPAELNGRKRRQLVQLPFIFKLQPAGTPVTDTLQVKRQKGDSAA